MCLTTITTCNNYNKVYLRIPKIYNLKFINLTITEPCDVIPVQYLSLFLLIPSLQVTPANVRPVPMEKLVFLPTFDLRKQLQGKPKLVSRTSHSPRMGDKRPWERGLR